MIVSSDYNIERANINFADVCKADIRKIVGKKCFEVFAARNNPCDGCPLSESIDKDKPLTKLLGNKINSREFEVNAYPYLFEGRQIKAGVMYYHDVTEEIRLHQEAIQNAKMAVIGMLAGGVAHEINNPLGGILVFAQMLIRNAKIKDDPDLLNDVTEIEKAAKRCKKIVNDLLDYSRISKNGEKATINIAELLKTMLPFLQKVLKSSNINLDLDFSKELPQIKGIPDRIQQVLINLLTNACHAMPNGGTLTVKTIADKRDLVLMISDTGVGISSEDLDRIFDPFYTTKQQGKGTGLGLSIVQRIIEEHGGEISVNSEVGKGTTFMIKFKGE